jgi:hypothetical protein
VGTPILRSVVGWLRAGYPTDMPEHGYVPLVALLPHRLSSQQVAAVVAALTRGDVLPAGRVEIGVAVTGLTDALPVEEDVHRVCAALHRVGWPVVD